MRDLWRDHSLGIVTVAFFLVVTLLLIWPIGWHEFVSQQKQHGQPISLTEYAWFFSHEYWMSLVADIFGGLYLIFATKYMSERGSGEG